MAYVNFVNHCYVDTEVEMKEIYTSNHIWTLFENFTLDMARVCPCGGVGLQVARGVWGPGQPSRGWEWRRPVCWTLPGISLSLLPRSAVSGRSVWLTPPWRSTC